MLSENTGSDPQLGPDQRGIDSDQVDDQPLAPHPQFPSRSRFVNVYSSWRSGVVLTSPSRHLQRSLRKPKTLAHAHTKKRRGKKSARLSKSSPNFTIYVYHSKPFQTEALYLETPLQRLAMSRPEHACNPGKRTGRPVDDDPREFTPLARSPEKEPVLDRCQRRNKYNLLVASPGYAHKRRTSCEVQKRRRGRGAVLFIHFVSFPPRPLAERGPRVDQSLRHERSWEV